MTSSQVCHTLTAMPQYAQLYKPRPSIGYSYSIEKKNGWETGCKFRINCLTFRTENEYILIINVEKVYAKFIPTHFIEWNFSRNQIDRLNSFGLSINVILSVSLSINKKRRSFVSVKKRYHVYLIRTLTLLYSLRKAKYLEPEDFTNELLLMKWFPSFNSQYLVSFCGFSL